MRFLTTLVFYLIWISTAIAQSTSITSSITDVTIFSSGVQTVRSATTRINQGNNKLILKDLSPLIQSNTIRVTIEGNGIVQSVQYGLSTPDDQSRTKERLRNEQFFAQKNDQITRLRNDLKVVNQEEAMLQKNQVQVIGLTNYTLKPAELEDLIAMQNRRMTAVIARQYDLNGAITQAETQRDSLKRVVDNLKINLMRPTGELTIDVYVLSEPKEDSRAFDLVFKNKKTAPVHLVVLDQIPVSTKKSIEVKPADLSGATLDEKTGIMEWKIDLKPGGTEKRKMGYAVRYPKGKIVVLE